MAEAPERVCARPAHCRGPTREQAGVAVR